MAKLTLDRSPTEEAKTKAQLLNCAFIMLGHGKFALVDSDAYPTISRWTWHFNLRGYAARLQYRGVDKSDAIVYLHRFVKGDYPNVIYDHINRDNANTDAIEICKRNITDSLLAMDARKGVYVDDSAKHEQPSGGTLLTRLINSGKFKKY